MEEFIETARQILRVAEDTVEATMAESKGKESPE